jgi:hypothetical protein
MNTTLRATIIALALGAATTVSAQRTPQNANLNTTAALTALKCGDQITMPGYYYLPADLACPAAPGIQVATHNVTIDLNGKTLSKLGTAMGAAIITANNQGCFAAKNLIVRNGNISNWGTGVSLCAAYTAYPTSTFSKVFDLKLTSVGTGISTHSVSDNWIHDNVVTNLLAGGIHPGVGIVLSGSNNVVKQNQISGGSRGIVLEPGAKDNTLALNHTKGNSQYGVHVRQGAVSNKLTMNTALSNLMWDLFEENANCGGNEYITNTAITKNLGCIQ